MIPMDRDRGMESNLDLPFFHKKFAFRHEIVAPLDRYRDNGRLACRCKKKSSSTEFLHFAIAAPCSLWKNQKRMPFFFHQPGGMIDAFFAASDAFPINWDKIDLFHAQADDRDSEDLFFQYHPDRQGNNTVKQRTIEKTQMVGHEYVGFILFDNIDPRHFDTNPEYFGTDPQSIFASPENGSRSAEHIAQEKDGNQKKGDQNIGNEEDYSPHP